MGQSQSTGSKASEPQGKSGQKTDYYELLGVTQTATDDEIKKAYRKKALELHPDRNYGNVEEATRLFAEIQSAYEVLADPQERAWYDSHSDAFLGTEGGSDGGPQSYTTADEVLKVFSKFSPRMDFSDLSTGFFGGLREQFTQLALEERLACQLEGLDMVEYPSFGGRDDSFETVVRPFYAAWAGFSTRKSFAWKDTYRYSEAPDRRVRRLMEKENRQLREEGIREFNDAVRSLVAFVKKRDPRYKANAQSEAQRQETLRQIAAAQAARSRAINQARMRDHVVPEWARSEEPGIEEEEESEESEIENFECVACNKTFKSQNQFEAHERSKKHVKAVKQLCREMRAQDKYLDLEPTIHTSTAPTTTVPSESDDLVTVISSNEQSEGFAIIETEGSPLMEPVTLSPSDSDNNDHEDPEPISSITPGDDDDDDDDNYASRESVQMRLHSDVDSSKDDSMTSLAEQLSSSVIDDRPAAVFRMGKAKQKRAKKAAQNDEQATGILCANCHATFTSRTKLFTHIKENPSHAQPLKTTKNKKTMRTI